jgi:hypothetical protein
MTIHTDRIVLVFPIPAKNRLAAASLQTLEITESGKEFETLIPLDPALVNGYADEFNLGWEAEKEVLAAAHKAALDAKQAALDTANATIARLESEVAALSVFRPFNPRHLASTDVLLARLTQKETKAFYSSNDPMILGGQALFDEYETEGYYVDLDDVNVQNLTGYMVQLGMLESMERRAVILRDATPEEARYSS